MEEELKKIEDISEKEAKILIKELYEVAEYNAKLYYEEDTNVISDYEYDILIRKIKYIEEKYPKLMKKNSITSRVGGIPNSTFQKVEHEYPLQSLQDVFSYEEIKEFDNRVKKGLNLKEDDNIEYVVETKIDGLSAALVYENGKYIKGATRGNGTIGEDITNNLRVVNGVPKNIEYKGNLVVRGEVFMSKDTFSKINEEIDKKNEEKIKNSILENIEDIKLESNLANPRNAAAGTLRQKNINIVKERNLEIFIFNVQNELNGISTHKEGLDFLEKQGFVVNEYVKKVKNIDEAIKKVEEIGNLRSSLPFGIDGAVIKVNNLSDREKLGVTSKYPKWAVAYKYPPEQKIAKIKEIQCNVGRTGIVTPLAIFEEGIYVDGSKIAKATLHNIDIIKQKDIRINDFVYIQKAGDVIPEVVDSIKEKREKDSKEFEMPTFCPSCNQFLDITNSTYKCVNNNCPAIIERKIIHFASKGAMDIIGLGDRIITKLIELEKINDVADIYTLTLEDLKEVRKSLREVKDLDKYNLQEDKKEEFKWENNLLTSIENSKKKELSDLLTALGIDGLGKTVSKKLCKQFNTIEKLENATFEDLIEIRDIGNILAKNIVEYFENVENRELIKRLKELNLNMTESVKEILSNKLDGKTFVITGTLSRPRKEIQKLVEENGGKNISGISSKTNYLIAGDDAGSKLDKAKEKNVTIITEEEFIELLK